MQTIRRVSVVWTALAMMGLAGCAGNASPPAKSSAVAPAGDATQGTPTATPTESAQTPPSDEQPGGPAVATQLGSPNGPTQPQAEPPVGKTEPEAPAAAPAELLAKALSAARRGDVAAAQSVLEQAVAADPENREALLFLASLIQQQAITASQGGDQKAALPLFLKSAEYAKKLRAAYPKLNPRESSFLAVALYNEACAESLGGHSDKALAALSDAVDAGFNDMAQIEKDTDLDPLRELPEFKTLMKEVPERLLARAKEHAQELLAEHEPFEFDFALPNLDGETVSLKDFAGKILIVDFWGTWCPPCRMEIPHFVELHKKYREAGLEIVGLNYERVPEDKVNETIGSFVKENDITYKCLIGDDKTSGQVPNLRGYPTTLFIDRSGKVRLMVAGYHSQYDLEGIVTTLLSEKPAAPAAN